MRGKKHIKEKKISKLKKNHIINKNQKIKMDREDNISKANRTIQPIEIQNDIDTRQEVVMGLWR